MDYRLYPSKETQLQWLRSYLRAYKQLTQGEQGPAGVSQEELEALYVQVNKFSLVSGKVGRNQTLWSVAHGVDFWGSWGFVLQLSG